MAAEKEKLQALQGRLIQSGAWANPTLNYSQEGYSTGLANTGFFDDQEFLIWASQDFELGGQRGKRHDLAQLQLDAGTSRYQDFIRLKRLEIQRSYVRLFYSSKRKESLRSALERYEKIRDAHRRRYELGEVSGLAQMKIEAEELGHLVELARAEREFQTSWAQFASLIAWEGTTLPQLSLAETQQAQLPDPSVLIRRAIESRPDLKAQQLETLVAEAAVAVEKSKNVPNLNLGGGYKRDSGQNSFYFGVRVPLPIWDRRTGAIAEKLATSRRQGMLKNWKEAWIRNEVQLAHSVFTELLEASRRLGPGFLQKLDQTVEITALSYQAGEAGILEFIDALRTRRSAFLAQNRLLEELHMAELELEASVAAPLGERVP